MNRIFAVIVALALMLFAGDALALSSTKTFNVPAAGAAGTSLDVTGLEPTNRVFTLTGLGTLDVFILEGSANNTNWLALGTRFDKYQPSTSFTNSLPYYRLRRLGGAATVQAYVSGTATVSPTNSLGDLYFEATLATTDATVTTIISYTPPDSGSYSIISHCNGNQSDDSNIVAYVNHALIKKIGAGTVSAIGAVTAISGVEDGALAAAAPPTFVVAGSAVNIKVTGVAATNIDWKCKAIIQKL